MARGSLKIDVPRVGSNDAAIAAANGLRIDGAADIQLNGVRRYDDAPLASTADVRGNRAQLVTQQWLDQVVDPHSVAWIDGALGNLTCSSARARWVTSAFVPACRWWRGAATPTRTAT